MPNDISDQLTQTHTHITSVILLTYLQSLMVLQHHDL